MFCFLNSHPLIFVFKKLIFLNFGDFFKKNFHLFNFLKIILKIVVHFFGSFFKKTHLLIFFLFKGTFLNDLSDIFWKVWNLNLS